MDLKLKESLRQTIEKGDLSKIKKITNLDIQLASELLFFALKNKQERIAYHLLETQSNEKKVQSHFLNCKFQKKNKKN